MEEANCEDHGTPVGAVHLLEELLGDQGGEGFVQAGFEALGGLVGHLDDFLEETQGETVVGLAGDPQTEVLVGLHALAVDEPDDGLFGLLHKLESQLTILQNDPSSTLSTSLNDFPGHFLLTLTHRHLFCGEFLLLPGELVNRARGIGTSRQQEQNGNVVLGLGPDTFDGVGNWLGELGTEDGVDEPAGSDEGSVFTN